MTDFPHRDPIETELSLDSWLVAIATALVAMVFFRWAWRAGVESLPYSGRTLTRESQALISQLDCASRSAVVTGPPFQEVSIALLMVL